MRITAIGEDNVVIETEPEKPTTFEEVLKEVASQLEIYYSQKRKAIIIIYTK